MDLAYFIYKTLISKCGYNSTIDFRINIFRQLYFTIISYFPRIWDLWSIYSYFFVTKRYSNYFEQGNCQKILKGTWEDIYVISKIKNTA